MAHPKRRDEGQIRVADTTIAQLSRGLYRSTATAFKELVSNAYDADATVVRIDTNCPEFDFLSCVDDGAGMPLEQFLRYFSKEGIGSCNKRKGSTDRTPVFKRPIIGRLGIGMLAVGQLCHSFEIESHYRQGRKGKAYCASIVLEDTAIPSMEQTLRNADRARKDMQVGTWKYKIVPYEKRKKGFRIHSSDVRKTFTREMRSSVTPERHGRMSFSLEGLHSTFYDKSKKSVRDCGSYLESIWELCTLCPVPYYGKGRKKPIDFSAFSREERESAEFQEAIRFIRGRQDEFLKQNFRVVFDGINLYRHIHLPTEAKTIPKLYSIDFDGTVLEDPLTFSGYLFAQVPCAVRPPELNGVQIRLRGIGIGGYDSTFLRYSQQIDTIRSRWVSGEIFVDHGLESALNIDRDSFNEHDEHFKKLQSELHRKLGVVFDEIDRIARRRSEGRREGRDKEVRKHLKAILADRSAGKLKLRQRDLGPDSPIVLVDDAKGEIILNKSARPLRKKKANRILGAVMLAYHAAQRTTGTGEKPDEAFYELLKAILAKLT